MAGKKFQFPLGNVMKVRERATEAAQRSLAAAADTRREHEVLVAQSAEAIASLHARAHTHGVASPHAFRRFEGQRQQAHARHAEAQQRLRQAECDEQTAREHLLGRKRDEEALRSLYEQGERAHRKELQAAEMAFLDELAVVRFNRSKSSSQA